jgi:acetyl-CoA/propionyl-CoA carboxylase, biotin carboxylase, biotin carboxyl carrier protein
VTASSGAPPFGTVLVANRGEIAVRIISTLRRLGIRSAAVYSDADRDAPHVLAADVAVRLGPAVASESYLHVERLVEAARSVGADAVHPGYGFVSEHTGFARACAEAGIVFVGPPPDAIEAMGDKIRAKRTVAAAGVSVVPGRADPDLSDADLREASIEVGFPVLIKPSAGGGGKGMRRVDDPSGLDDAIASARREAAGAFGDDTLFVERFVARPRHIEIQVLLDAHGGAVHLGERECSLQRRHQKIVEEAPSVLLTPERREAMGAQALAAAAACGYTNAGTVEFIVSADRPDEPFFMEMNTRLQVEHPVTEMVWGLDLVEQQLRVAAGESLAFAQADLHPTGHAVEARLYAEDPAAGFVPSPGRIVALTLPGTDRHLRVDAGVAEGQTVGTDYDPMLAKVIAWGADRAAALTRLDHALAEVHVAGLTTNTAFLRRLLALDEVTSGDLDTDLVERRLAELTERALDVDTAVVAALAVAHERRTSLDPSDPWNLRTGWRLGEHAWTVWRATVDGHDVVVRTRGEGDVTEASVNGADAVDCTVRTVSDGRVDVEIDGRHWHGRVTHVGTQVWVTRAGESWRFVEHDPVRTTRAGAGPVEGVLRSPMPGTVVSVNVSEGDVVAAGQVVVSVEAMKMEHALRAPFDGVVSQVSVVAGAPVDLGATLAVVTPHRSTDDQLNDDRLNDEEGSPP